MMIDAELYAQLQVLCRRSFPERLEQRVSQVQSIEGGRHPSVAFSLAWREGRRPRVERLLLRRYADGWTWWETQDAHKAQRAWEVGCWLYGRGLPVPTLYASGTAAQAPYLLMARPAGRGYRLEGPPDREAYAESATSLLARLHRLRPPDTIRRLLPEVHVQDEIARLSALATGGGDEGLVEALNDLATSLVGSEEMEDLPPCVLHGDLQVDRVRADARGITAVLDWETAALGDPRWDLSQVGNELHRLEARDLVARVYRRYEEASGNALGRMSYWEALSAVQRWTVLAWLEGSGAAGPTGALDAARRSAWRALTRLRYGRGDAT
jgi:aminoglycoside phosphotransferase (APT) family kinase protein